MKNKSACQKGFILLTTTLTMFLTCISVLAVIVKCGEEIKQYQHLVREQFEEITFKNRLGYYLYFEQAPLCPIADWKRLDENFYIKIVVKDACYYVDIGAEPNPSRFFRAVISNRVPFPQIVAWQLIQVKGGD